MKYLHPIVIGVLSGLVVVGAGGAAWWLVFTKPAGAAKMAQQPLPATVPQPLKEDQINAMTLTPDALKRLDLQTGKVERKWMPRTRVYGGEVTIPVGRTILVAAPLSGTLKALPNGMPAAGQTVTKGQALFQFLPLLTPEGRANLAASKIDADGQVKTAQTQLDAGLIALDRAKKVFLSEAGSRRAVDEAQAQVDLAQKALDAATARRDLLEKVVGEVEKGTAGPLTIQSPEEGLLRNVSALPGQNVPTGGALFEVANLKKVWVRVPVYVGDLADMDLEADASVGDLALRPGQLGRPGKTAKAPPSANPGAATVDLFYETINEEGTVHPVAAANAAALCASPPAGGPFSACAVFAALRLSVLHPGQRVGVTLLLKSEEKSLTVPWSAVIHDIHGGTWVYEQTGDRAYVRRRVVVRYVVADRAVLAAGPPAGTRVVTAGAAELFGTETGFTK